MIAHDLQTSMTCFCSFLQSMEVFQSRLEAAEKVAPRKENYYKSDRWKKTDYLESEKEKKEQHMKKETRDEGDRNRSTFGGHARGKYGKEWAQEEQGYKRDTSRQDQGCGHSSTDSVLRGYSSKAASCSDEKRSQEKRSSLSSMKHKFLKPSEDDSSSYSALGGYKSQESSCKLPVHSSLSSRFQKPGEDTALWTKTHTEDNNEKLISDQKSSGSREQTDDKSWKRTPRGEKEKSPQECAGDIPEKKQTLSDNKTSCARYFTNIFTSLEFVVFFVAKNSRNSVIFEC